MIIFNFKCTYFILSESKNQCAIQTAPTCIVISVSLIAYNRNRQGVDMNVYLCNQLACKTNTQVFFLLLLHCPIECSVLTYLQAFSVANLYKINVSGRYSFYI